MSPLNLPTLTLPLRLGNKDSRNMKARGTAALSSEGPSAGRPGQSRKGSAPGLESGLLQLFRLLSPLVYFTRMIPTFFASDSPSPLPAAARTPPTRANAPLVHRWSTFTTFHHTNLSIASTIRAGQILFARRGQTPVCVSASEPAWHAYQTYGQIVPFP